jgi:hypothetical protein
MVDRTPEMDDRIDTYLDGAMDEAEALRFERDLSEPEAFAAYRESLGLREMLRRIGPDAPPEGLENRIRTAVGFVPRDGDAPANRAGDRYAASGRNEAISPFAAAAGALAWTVRGPAIAVRAPAAGARMRRARSPQGETVRDAWTGTASGITATALGSAAIGFQSMRWMLGPLASSYAEAAKPASKRPWWSRALRRGLWKEG